MSKRIHAVCGKKQLKRLRDRPAAEDQKDQDEAEEVKQLKRQKVDQ